jgi:hypothetical protein
MNRQLLRDLLRQLDEAPVFRIRFFYLRDHGGDFLMILFEQVEDIHSAYSLGNQPDTRLVSGGS